MRLGRRRLAVRRRQCRRCGGGSAAKRQCRQAAVPPVRRRQCRQATEVSRAAGPPLKHTRVKSGMSECGWAASQALERKWQGRFLSWVARAECSGKTKCDRLCPGHSLESTCRSRAAPPTPQRSTEAFACRRCRLATLSSTCRTLCRTRIWSERTSGSASGHGVGLLAIRASVRKHRHLP